jgi:hypothetical protein
MWQMNKWVVIFWVIFSASLILFTGWRAHEDGRRDGRVEVLNMWADKERAEIVNSLSRERPAWVEFWGSSITSRVGWLGGPRMIIEGGRLTGEW